MKSSLKTINDYVLSNPQELVERAEKHYKRELCEIAQTIADNDDIKIVAVAGPSGAGKTTTSHILCDNLKALGEVVEVVSLDDFYLSADRLPKLPDGTRDIESVYALDIELIRNCLNEVIVSGKTSLPKYDFITKEQILNARQIDISGRGILIVEGLHAMNPIISELIPRKNIFKAYISVNRTITDEEGNTLLSGRQIRFIRRILRDRIFRGASVSETMTLWQGVIAGEEKYLYCFKDTADVLVKTLHIYEPALYRDMFLSLAREVIPDTPCYLYFEKTVLALKEFESLDSGLIPEESLIREFIGSGKYN